MCGSNNRSQLHRLFRLSLLQHNPGQTLATTQGPLPISVSFSLILAGQNSPKTAPQRELIRGTSGSREQLDPSKYKRVLSTGGS
jgi:hypothetical protein